RVPAANVAPPRRLEEGRVDLEARGSVLDATRRGSSEGGVTETAPLAARALEGAQSTARQMWTGAAGFITGVVLQTTRISHDPVYVDMSLLDDDVATRREHRLR
ncbi:MAG TPA: hypothetical protein VFT22_19090, partial [Kofleriaceae bacterium]|nr:hypothetical protein [Kofleriaceae bacterium]